ncbi:caspase family protein [Marimonas sp. MJW-29]|uniref:Caspase family protein n=1 Tax=Sulfitobacter sediminis TaxID=3234186 RepID=A0ABV3RJP6_9RHOB
MVKFASYFLIAAMVFICIASAADARRVALVIGNSDYTHATTLPNPANDARDLATAFTRLGYQVELVEDATRADLLDALRGFRARSIGAEHAIIYYAGHGVEIDRQNFVIPVDAELKADIDVEYEAVPLDLLVAATSGARDLQLVVLDACRDNPFLAQMTRTLSTRSIGRGLAIYEPDGNSLVAYSAREGTVALDGTGQNSPYAMAFLSALERPGLEIGQFFRQVRDAVIRQTNGQQEPFLYGSLSAEPVFFKPDAASVTPAPQAAAPAQRGTDASADTLLAIDLAFWQSIKDSDQPSDFEDYLSRFPNGQFLPLAQRRLAALKAPQEPARSAVREPEASPPASAVPAATPKPDPLPEPLRLSRSEARDLQARLNILGYSAGVEDGIVGRRTMRAVAEYKSTRAMPLEDQIDAALMAWIAAEVPSTRLAAYRDAKRPATPSTPAPAAAPKPKAQTAAKPAPAPRVETKPAASSGNLAGFVGRSYCRSKGGQVLNGRNLSDRPIWCITVLSLSDAQIRYRVSQRQSAGQPLNQSVFTRNRTGTRTYGPVRLAASGSGSLTANGSPFVASQIYR